ncbi:restriction endonuclease subunit S [Cellulophaga sp. L1A9]|uniref:restriction endonuclease subunit S n=1 Tax=Cellulophaga sp. L1A9 TaxID=2686362 RepID=UPI0018EEF1D6|nr:restriction endonuclease subunit S [Cellulophaga sp. L1A9]
MAAHTDKPTPSLRGGTTKQSVETKQSLRMERSEAKHSVDATRTLVPKLRFKEFDGDIVKYLFSDIFLFSTGKNIKQNEASPEFETPCVRYGELYHMYNEVINDVINKTNLDKSELLFSKGDEILLPSAGEDPLDIGSASALTLENIAIGRTINVLRPLNKNIYSQIYASYYINQKLRKKISTLAKGSSISNVYNSDLKTLKINLPSLPEQQKIASFLSAVDEKIQQLTKKKALLEQYKKGVMQQLFSGKLRFKDENGKAYPDWEEKRLGEIASFLKGKGISKADLSLNGKLKCIRYGELYTVYGETIDKVFSKTNVAEKELVMSEKGDVIIPASGETQIDIATASCVINANIALGGDLNIIRSANNGIFLAYYLNSALKFDIARLSQGVSVVHLYSSQLKTLKIGVPQIEEQQKIATYLSNIDTKIESVNNQITKTQSFKKGLLQGMFV